MAGARAVDVSALCLVEEASREQRDGLEVVALVVGVGIVDEGLDVGDGFGDGALDQRAEGRAAHVGARVAEPFAQDRGGVAEAVGVPHQGGADSGVLLG